MKQVLYLLFALSAAYAAFFTRTSPTTRFLLEKREATAPEAETKPLSGHNTKSSTCKVVKPYEMLDDLTEMVGKTVKTVEGILAQEKAKLEKLQNQKPEGICANAIKAQENRVRIAGLIVDGAKEELAKLKARKRPGTQSAASEITPQMSFAELVDKE